MEGRRWLIDKTLNLNKKLLEQIQMGEERAQFYAEVRESETGYYRTWKTFLLRGKERPVIRYESGNFSIDWYQQRQVGKTFQDRIEKEFGRQVLDDILI